MKYHFGDQNLRHIKFLSGFYMHVFTDAYWYLLSLLIYFEIQKNTVALYNELLDTAQLLLEKQQFLNFGCYSSNSCFF